MIKRDTIEEIRSRMDIVDVIGDFVTLKRSGNNYKALSPFTNEKTPSFFVIPAKGIFKDFSSGKGGDAITFVMEHEGFGYVEAIRFLAKKYGIEIQEDDSPADKESTTQRESLYLVMGFAKDHYRRNLTDTEEGRGVGLSYFHERGFDDRTIEKFELGYALDKWNDLGNVAGEKGYSEEILEKSGLIIRKGNSSYDRFRGRVIFPVHNLSGKVIAFGARILTKEKKVDQPKYVNSPETEIYHKSNALFGMFLAKNDIRKEDNCFLVEGYTDVISMHQAGVTNVVAASGTALTDEQIKLIARFSSNVTVLFDGDSAGIKAALRGIDMILAQGMNVRVVLLPEGHDPDSYSRSATNAELLQYLREQSKDFISFKAGLFVKEAGSDPIKRAESIREIVGSIAKVPDSIKRTVYLQETAVLLKMPEQVLFSELNKLIMHNRRSGQNDEPPPPPEPVVTEEQEVRGLDSGEKVQVQERETIRLLLNYAENEMRDASLAEYLFAELDDVTFSNPLFAELFRQMRERWESGNSMDSSWFLEHGTPEVRNLVADLVTPRYGTSEHWQDKYHIFLPKEHELVDQLASTHVLRLKFRMLQSLISANLEAIRQAEPSGDWENLETLLIRHQEFKNAERQLAETLGIVVAG